MSRLSMEVTPEQYQRVKALAAFAGKSIKEFLLDKALVAAPVGESVKPQLKNRARRNGFPVSAGRIVVTDEMVRDMESSAP